MHKIRSRANACTSYRTCANGISLLNMLEVENWRRLLKSKHKVIDSIIVHASHKLYNTVAIVSRSLPVDNNLLQVRHSIANMSTELQLQQ
jgi:hypothetical protein